MLPLIFASTMQRPAALDVIAPPQHRVRHDAADGERDADAEIHSSVLPHGIATLYASNTNPLQRPCHNRRAKCVERAEAADNMGVMPITTTFAFRVRDSTARDALGSNRAAATRIGG